MIKESLLRATGHTIIPEFLPASSDQASEPSASLPGADSNGPSLSKLITSFFEDKSGNVYSRVIARVERELIAQALLATQGHQAQASERLGINRTTLRNKLRELGISLDKVVSTAVELPTD